jgi:hypothetical protein
MKLLAMNQQVSDELTHIPKHPKEHQSELRALYAMLRKASLGKHGDSPATPGRVLREAIAALRKDRPDAVFLYDEAFFGD